MQANRRYKARNNFLSRQKVILVVLGIVSGLMLSRAVYLQVYNNDFLRSQGERRHMRLVDMHAYRGMVTDRHGAPLAISTPVKWIEVDPRKIHFKRRQLKRLARLLRMSQVNIETRIIMGQKYGRASIALRRQVSRDIAARIKKMKIAGVYVRRRFKRYYPTGAAGGHIVGFTNVDDKGQEGIELAFDKVLSGIAGLKRVRKNSYGQHVEAVEHIRATTQGRPVVLSVDSRLQYLSYQALKHAVRKHQATSASLVMLDVQTGEILAMVNQPTFNPNNRKTFVDDHYRNRAVIDPLEPGSTIKPFVIAAALESGVVHPHTRINTAPGKLKVEKETVKDTGNMGKLDPGQILMYSSNVGASMVGLKLGRHKLWNMYQKLGLGEKSKAEFPAESQGKLANWKKWNKVDLAWGSYGYGLSVTPLQLAKAYAVIAADGKSVPVTILKRGRPAAGKQVMSAETARHVRDMLEKVVSPGGTGNKAAVPGYRIAGKTGTVRRFKTSIGYEPGHIALFAGMAPASNPRIVVVVVVNNPQAGEYYGGQVAAPVFAKVMQGALRILDVAPDGMMARSKKIVQQPFVMVDGRL